MTMTKQAQLLEQAQLFQQQMQGIAAQREALNMQLIEINKSMEELEKTKEKEIYKISGPILIKQGTEEVKKDLDEKKQLIGLRIKTLEKSEQKLAEKLEELREKAIKAKGSGLGGAE